MRQIFFILLSFMVFIPGAKADPSTPSRSRVILFYVDGLRPDNVEEMVELGELPNIKELFFNKGLRFSNMFTIFPSNTVISNGLFMTGKWPENTGLKSQALFERFEVEGQGHLEHFVERIAKDKSYPRYYNLLTQTEVAPRLLRKNKVPTLFNYLRERFHTTVVPINPDSAPTTWVHVASNVVPHFYKVALESPEKIDTINGEYAMQYMLADKRADLFLIWFPGLDDQQHADREGQFGKVREALVLIDDYIGKIHQGMLNGMKPEERLVTVLFSDHGAYGGKYGQFNQPFHFARDYLYQTLKMNVRGPDFSITHPGTNPQAFTFVDNMGPRQMKLYFPLQDSTSVDWSRKNNFYDLEHYGLGPNRKPINLITEISGINLAERNVLPELTSPFPVDLIMMRLDKKIFYVRRFNGSEAFIEVRRTEDGEEFYRYQPVEDVHQNEDGSFRFQESLASDPFGYLEDPGFLPSTDRLQFINKEHSAQEWLEATYKTQYPDAIVAMTKSLGWNDSLEATQANSRDPDMVLSAAPGWNFRIEAIEGADHGALLADSMRVTFMISGPGIKQGVLEAPHRLIELAPTVLKLLAYEKPTQFDVEPMQDIYES